MLQPIYDTKKVKCQVAKKCVKAGCCLHCYFCMIFFMFVFYMIVVLGLGGAMDIEAVEIREGTVFLILIFAIVLGTYIFYWVKYRRDLAAEKNSKAESKKNIDARA